MTNLEKYKNNLSKAFVEHHAKKTLPTDIEDLMSYFTEWLKSPATIELTENEELELRYAAKLGLLWAFRNVDNCLVLCPNKPFEMEDGSYTALGVLHIHYGGNENFDFIKFGDPEPVFIPNMVKV